MNQIVFLNTMDDDFDDESPETESQDDNTLPRVDSTNFNTTVELDIHIRVQQRNARKRITIVEGLTKKVARDLLIECRKCFNTNGVHKEDEDGNNIVQFQGDIRKDIKKYIILHKITAKEHVHVHGF